MAQWKQNNNTKQQQKNNQWKTGEMGKIAGYLGTGDNAKNSIVFLVIKYCFWAATILCILIALNCWFFQNDDSKSIDLTHDIKKIWEIVTPIITLALGYLFGRNK